MSMARWQSMKLLFVITKGLILVGEYDDDDGDIAADAADDGSSFHG